MLHKIISSNQGYNSPPGIYMFKINNKTLEQGVKEKEMLKRGRICEKL